MIIKQLARLILIALVGGLMLIPWGASAAPYSSTQVATSLGAVAGDLNNTTCRNKRTGIMSRSIKAGPPWRRHNYLVSGRVGYKSCLSRFANDYVQPIWTRTTVTQTTDEDCGDHIGEVGYKLTRARIWVRQTNGNVTQLPGLTVRCVDAGGVIAVMSDMDLNRFKAFPVVMKNGRLTHPWVTMSWRVAWQRADDGHGSDFTKMYL